MTEYFINRHTIRKFKPEVPDDSLIASIVGQAVHAPTTGNMQLYSVIATRDKENKKLLDSLHFNQPAAVSAPVILTVCADLYKFSRWCATSNADAGFDNLQGLMYAILDAVIFSQQIVTIAEIRGLGSCYLGTVSFNAREISNLLNLPPMTLPVTAIALGWPDETPGAIERIGTDGILHFEKYPDLSDQDIRKIYAVKDEFPANAEYVKEHAKENIAQVFTDIRYPRKMNEEFSGPLLDFIRRQGFKI